MLVHFEKQNEEGRNSQRGILAIKYFRIWKGEGSMLQFIALKEKIEEDMLKICEGEIELAHDACSDTLEFIDKMFTVGRIHRPSRRGAVTDNTGGSLDPFSQKMLEKTDTTWRSSRMF